MKSKGFNLETILLLLISIGLFAISPPKAHLRLLNFVHHSSTWGKYADGMSQVFILYGMVLLILAILSYLSWLHGITLISQVSRLTKDVFSLLRNEIIPSIHSSFASKAETIWILLALIMGIGIRAYFLAQPIRYDEAFTFLKFTNQGFINLFYYPLPNNHVLYTLLIKTSTLVWGNSPAAIRLPAFLAGIGSIPLIFCLSRSLRKSGIFASISVSVFPYLILYSTIARGYSLLVLLTIALAYVGVQISTREPSAIGAALLSLIAALGMLTIPSMLFPIAGIYCWLFVLFLIKGHKLRFVLSKFVVPCSLFTVIFTIILYTPVILASNGIESIIANKYVQSQPWSEFIGQVLPHFQATIGDFIRDIPVVVLFICITLAIVGIYDSVRKRDWPSLLLLPTILLGSAVIFFIQHAIPFARTWIYIIPFILLYIDSGFTFIVEILSHRIRFIVTVLLFAAGTFAAISLISKDAIAKYPDTGSFPEAQMVVNYLEPIMKSNDLVYEKTPADYPTYFYLWSYDRNEHNGNINIKPRNTFYIVEKSMYSIKDMTDGPVKKLLDIGDMALYEAVNVEDK
jgi:hypothetical protein